MKSGSNLKIGLVLVLLLSLLVGCHGSVASGQGREEPQKINENKEDEKEIESVKTEKKETLKVMTYNVLLNPEKEGRPVNFGEEMAATVREQDPDLFGTQENTQLIHEVSFAGLTEYACFRGEELSSDPAYRGNYAYWKKDKFKAIEKGHQFMSDTPDVKSKFEGSKEYRGFTYVFLESRETGNRFLFIALHADYRAEESVRVKQLRVLTAFLQSEKWADVPAVVVGDFNSTAQQDSISTFLAENPGIAMTSEAAKTKGDTAGTLIVGGFTTRQDYVFDYVFVTKDRIETEYYSVILNKKEGKYPSDHLPVVARLTLR